MGISRRTVLISAACAGDGAPMGGWWHWSANWSQSVKTHFQWMQRYRTAVGAWQSFDMA